MKIKFDKRDYYLIGLILLMFVVGAYFYPKLPDNIPIHWGPNGQIDAYGSKNSSLFMLPIMAVILYLILTLIPYIEVYQKNLMNFYPYYYGLKFIIILFMGVMYAFTLLPNFNIIFNMNHFILPALALLFFYIGSIMKNFKRNFFVGIRTPWTLSDDKVWKKTHEKGSIIFKIAAFLTALGIFASNYAMWFILVPIIGGSVYLVVYSYVAYRKIGKKR